MNRSSTGRQTYRKPFARGLPNCRSPTLTRLSNAIHDTSPDISQTPDPTFHRHLAGDFAAIRRSVSAAERAEVMAAVQADGGGYSRLAAVTSCSDDMIGMHRPRHAPVLTLAGPGLHPVSGCGSVPITSEALRRHIWDVKPGSGWEKGGRA
jgi:hypothetical protein